MNAEAAQKMEKVVETESPFVRRHIGPRETNLDSMLKAIGLSSLEELIAKTVPSGIRLKSPLQLPVGLTEEGLLKRARELAAKNKVYRSYIGQGFYNSITPPVVLRNIMENPGWYTQYTPYQAEIAQGRLEALLNFQTMIMDLTAMEIANASLLDEASAVAEAVSMAARIKGTEVKNKVFADGSLHPQNMAVLKTRMEPLGIEVVEGSFRAVTLDETFLASVIQYPTTEGSIVNYKDFVSATHTAGAMSVVVTDLLALTLLTPPGEWGADIVVGNSQRFGVPLGFGGPHAAFMATKDEFKREFPGRLVGVSKDSAGNRALRLALQTREQHIRREKATSNICTAQVLLAIMASFYAVYHGPEGLRAIAQGVYDKTRILAAKLKKAGFKLLSESFFDTLTIAVSPNDRNDILARADKKEINLRFLPDAISLSLDETVTFEDLADIYEVITGKKEELSLDVPGSEALPLGLQRKSLFLEHEVFKKYHSETELLRYINRLAAKDLSLAVSMIPLGSCTMKLNATAEMVPVTWPEFASIHPFAPLSQAKGYLELIKELEDALCEITGFAKASLQPNAGSQGEYAGLLAIRAYHHKRGDTKRTICLIPKSAHGTNPATASMLGMDVVVVACDEKGNIDIADLKVKAEQHKAQLAAMMITYPSTHGVFEEQVTEACKIVHAHGGQVYMDGANLNAQVGLCKPAEIGADVCHINLHKTFCIPHGGGGPGVGPIAVAAHLAEFLPGHVEGRLAVLKEVGPIAAAPWGSAGILVISWAYIKMMGGDGLTEATKYAILNANYVAKRLEAHYPVLYKGKNGFIAHECILDLQNLKRSCGIEVQDIAKRLMDYGFHAPTVSFPVVETLMIEPTESESKEELDRFCDAMILIREEIKEVEEGKVKAEQSVLKNAPHTALAVTSDTWERVYSREKAAYPAPWLKESKFWPAVGRIDNTWGDRNLFCACG